MADQQWQEFVLMVPGRKETEVPVCGLCGGSGFVDTRGKATWGQKDVGMLGFCICPDGRKQKKMHGRTPKESSVATAKYKARVE